MEHGAERRERFLRVCLEVGATIQVAMERTVRGGAA